MSGVEILGIIASASQLTDYGLTFITLISKTYERIKDAPETIEQHLLNIKQLLSFTEHIQQTFRHHNPSVHEHIESIQLEARKLVAILEELSEQYSRHSVRGYFQILKGREEKRICDIFDKLEKAKSGLTLCITGCNADSLHDMLRIMKRIEEIMSHHFKQGKDQVETSEVESSERRVSAEESPSASATYCQLGQEMKIRTPNTALQPTGRSEAEDYVPGNPQHQLLPQNCTSGQRSDDPGFRVATTNSVDNHQHDRATSAEYVMRNVKVGRKGTFINGDRYNGYDDSVVPSGNKARRHAEDLDLEARCNVVNGTEHNSPSWWASSKGKHKTST